MHLLKVVMLTKSVVNRFRLCSSAINSKRNIVKHLEVASTKEMLSKFL